MDYLEEKNTTYLLHKRTFGDFLSDGRFGQQGLLQTLHNEYNNPPGAGGESIGTDRRKTRYLLNLNVLRDADKDLTRNFIWSPMQYYAPFLAALKEAMRFIGPAVDPLTKREAQWSIGVEGSFGANRLSPRQLKAQHLGQLVMVEGIATKCSIVRPKVVRTVHYCEATGIHTEMSYHDATSLTGFPTSSVYPTKDTDGNPLTTEFGLSSYMDHQTLAIQEMPERSPAGLLPSSIDVILSNDLVDTCKPGDRVAISGIYRALPTTAGDSAAFKTVLIANNVRILYKNIVGMGTNLTVNETTKIREISERRDLFSLMARSIAPSIYGHDDINLLMVGDPSTAKSQLLRFILHIAPLAINTTGRGSSGVGLTAAVTSDKETGDRRLEAGAMVLADRGIVCIDEFDKMSDSDRVAIHEVMEQQTVTIAKAGIHMTLNARCSVVAAANPRYSQYDATKTPAFNVNLPDSLLSRFDLLFIVLDHPDAEIDRAISQRVVNNHRYLSKGRPEDADEYDDISNDTIENQDRNSNAADIFQAPISFSTNKSKQLQVLKMGFMKKYIQFAKSLYEPILTPDSSLLIGQSFAELRQSDSIKNGYPITARCLETLIRLSTAHAKLRLSDTVTVEDVEVALGILRFAIEHDTKVQKKRKRNNTDETSSQGSHDSDDDGEENDDKRTNERILEEKENNEKSKNDTNDNMETGDNANYNEEEFEQKYSEDQNQVEADNNKNKKQKTSITPSLSSSSSNSQLLIRPARLGLFQKAVASHMKYLTESTFDAVLSSVNDSMEENDVEDGEFSKEEGELLLRELEKSNKIMFRKGMVLKI